MHILHIIPGDLWAGAEAQVYYTLREIKKQSDILITVLLFNRGELYHRLKNEDIVVKVIDEGKYSSHKIIRLLAQFLPRNKIDIIHTHEYKSHILGVLAKRAAAQKCPVIRTLHGRTSAPLKFNTLKSYFALHVENVFLRFFTQHIIAVSKDLKTELEQAFSRPAVHYINNAVDVSCHCVTGRKIIRREMGIADSAIWIVTAARLVSVKNIDLLIEAVRLLDKSNGAANYLVSIFGEGELRESLEKKVRDYSLEERILFHGHYNNIYAVFSSADIFTLTSQNEGLPMSLLEAMFLGAVAVCTSVGGMKEVIRHRENGFLVDPENPAELADVFGLLINNREILVPLQQRAVRTISERYSLEKTAAKLLNLYSSITHD